MRPTVLAVFAALLLVACGKDLIEPPPTPPRTPTQPTVTGTVTGTVTSSFTGKPVAGARVEIGQFFVSSGSDGRFTIRNVPAGETMLRCIARGFADFDAAITVTPGGVAHDIELTVTEVFEFDGDFAAYVPAHVTSVRGVIVALGGPDTRGFATGKSMGAPNPAVEASLQALGQALRTLASTHGLAVFGTSRSALKNEKQSDQLLFDAIWAAGDRSGRWDLGNAPLLMYGMSGGAPEASGFTARNPDWVAGLLLKVPSGVSPVSGLALGVPTFMIQAELDAFVDNAALTAAFESNRSAGALWGLAKEPGVPHHSLSAVQREVTINWINTIIELRMTEAWYDWWHPLDELAERSGWLANRSTGEASPFATYSGDRALASWLPSESAARDWLKLVAR